MADPSDTMKGDSIYMNSEDFDALMDLCKQLNFRNKKNRHIVPMVQTKLRELFMAYTRALSQREETVSKDEVMHELVAVMVMYYADCIGFDPMKLFNKFEDALIILLEEKERG